MTKRKCQLLNHQKVQLSPNLVFWEKHPIAPDSIVHALHFFFPTKVTINLLSFLELTYLDLSLDILEPESLTMKHFGKLKISNQHIFNFWSLGGLIKSEITRKRSQEQFC